MKNKFKSKPKVIKSDGGGEYLNHKLIIFLKEEETCPHLDNY